MNTEFNKVNQIYQGTEGKYAYHQRIPLLEEGGHTLRFNGLVKYNNETGQYDEWNYGEWRLWQRNALCTGIKGANRETAEDHGYM